MMEGEAMIIVKNGRFSIEENKASSFSQREFFAELRNRSIEHLGQVEIALLEVDGTISIVRYDDEHTLYGLPLFPNKYKRINPMTVKGPYACMFCGDVVEQLPADNIPCKRCHRKD